MSRRSETRLERYASKSSTARTFPFSLVTVEFICDGNLGYVMRAAACYGAAAVHCIGYVAPDTELKKFSGSMNKLLPLFQHRNCSEFLEWKRVNDTTGKLVVAELQDGSIDINRFRYPKEHTYIVVGNEMAGVPEELILNSSALVHIPMPGPGFCLNTSQTANVMAYEYIKQAMYDNG